MATGSRISKIAITIVAAVSIVCCWQAIQAAKPPVKPEKSPEKWVSVETLGGADRYQTQVSTDKPIYKPEEKVYIRGVILHRTTHAPLKAQDQAIIDIKGPKGDSVASGQVNAQDGVLGFEWPIPAEQAGGEYTVKITYPYGGHAPAERKFDIRNYRAPRLKSQIRFLRDGYGPGDTAAATLQVKRAEGGVPAGARVTVTARVDGLVAFQGKSVVDDQGNCDVRFPLPAVIERGIGTLALSIQDGGVVETATKTIPILLRTVDITMYPEGGDLVAGVPNRVYYQAFTPAGKPADLAGEVVDENGKSVAKFRSEHEGRGRFAFTPTATGKYRLRILKPSGVDTEYPLPATKADGATISSPNDVTTKGKISLQVASAITRECRVTLTKQETLISHTKLQLAPGKPATVQLDPGDVDGVMIATLWTLDGKPLAERLVFRIPDEQISVELKASAPRYVPGGKASITVTTTKGGKPISAMVGLTVTDDSVLEMVEKRAQAPRLPVMVLLENDVKDLADSHVYLDASDEKAPLAVDLLLGTQGWRRFALVNTKDFLAKNGSDGRRALAMKMVSRRIIAKSHGIRRDFFRGVPQAAPVDHAEAALDADPKAVDDPVEAAPVPLPVERPAVAPVAAPPVAPLVVAPPAAAAKPLPAREPLLRQAAKEAQGGGQRAPAANFDRIEFNKIQAVEQLSEQQADLEAALEDFEDADELNAIAGKKRRALRNDFVSVRVYAHQVRANRRPNQRTDFTETLYWHAGLKTNDKGVATIEFGLNDSVTSFQVAADAFDSAGSLGNNTINIESIEPFYVEPKLPLEVTQGDRILAPIGLVNATDHDLVNTFITFDGDKALSLRSLVKPTTLAAGERVRRMLELAVGTGNGPAKLTLQARSGPYSDRVTRSMRVVPKGFPTSNTLGGLIVANDSVTHEITIPEDLVPGSLVTSAAIYPTPLGRLTGALERLIRDPSGCFEQTSSTTYPLVMAQQYFMSHTGVDPTIIERSSNSLDKGYARLTGYECKQKGYEWFGADPGHSALTAYGLLEFSDMSQVRQVDPKMLERTREWLLGRRDGKGSFDRSTRTLHTWIVDPDCSNSYIVWALLESGQSAESLKKEIDWIRTSSIKSENSYVTALAANVMLLADDKTASAKLLDKLAGQQAKDGSVDGATTSVVGSGGQALKIETTALAVMAWLKDPKHVTNVEQGVKFLADSCEGGRFGSTQSTVLALRAIVAYDKARATPKADGSVELWVDGKRIGKPRKFTKETQGSIDLPDLAAVLTPGKHKVELRMSGGSRMPYSLAADFFRLQPDSAEACKVHMTVKLRDTELTEGAVTEAVVAVVNRTNEPIPTPTAIVGIPGGLEVRHDQLKELVKQGKIAAYEVIGREVVLYWRSLPTEARVELPLSLVAEIPGTYTGPSSRAYLYYTDEHKHWTPGLQVSIAPKK